MNASAAGVVLALLFPLSTTAPAQDSPLNSTLDTRAPPPPAGSVETAVVETGPHHRVWQTTRWITDEAGQSVPLEGQYLELCTGLMYWSADTETWEESVEAFELTPQGYAVALRGQQQLILAHDPSPSGEQHHPQSPPGSNTISRSPPGRGEGVGAVACTIDRDQ